MGFPEADYVVEEINTAVNKTMFTENPFSLNELLASKIKIRGFSGMKFDLTRLMDNTKFSVTLNDNDPIENSDTRIAYRFVYVPYGEYDILVNDFNGSGDFTIRVAVERGSCVNLTYTKLIEVARITQNTQYTFPSEPLFITVFSGGGGGGGGGNNSYSGKGYSKLGGSGGGGGGTNGIFNRIMFLKGQTKNITIGTGGSGGAVATKGSDGTPTVIQDIITLPGGTGGAGGVSSDPNNQTVYRVLGGTYNGGESGYGSGSYGGGGGGGGGAGGFEGTGGSGGNGSAGSNTEGQESSIPATNGEKGKNANGGTGGTAGKGGVTTSDSATPGGNGNGYGSGGGGGGGAGGSSNMSKYGPPASNGGNGSNGIVVIYKGVCVE